MPSSSNTLNRSLPVSKTALFGYGFVGKQTARKFKFDLIVDWDSKKEDYKMLKGKFISLRECDEVWIAVPTPSLKNGQCDVSRIMKIAFMLASANLWPTLVIRSTVTPGTAKKLQDMGFNVISFPELLRAKKAKQDMDNPWAIIIGSEANLFGIHFFQNEYLSAHMDKVFLTDNTTAELMKYANNTLFATLVVFANQIYDVSKKVGANYADIAGFLKNLPWAQHSHLDILTDGYRGYAGACLPKDTKALAKTFNLKLFKYVDQINQAYILNSHSNLQPKRATNSRSRKRN